MLAVHPLKIRTLLPSPVILPSPQLPHQQVHALVVQQVLSQPVTQLEVLHHTLTQLKK